VIVRFSSALAPFNLNLWGMIFTHGSTGLSRLCSLMDALLVGCRAISAVVPAIILFRMVGISRGNRGMAQRAIIRTASKYRLRVMLVKSRVGLLRINEINSIARVETNRAWAVGVIYLLFILLVGVVLGAFCLRLWSRIYIIGRVAITAIICTINGANPAVYVRWGKSGANISGSRKIAATMVTRLSRRWDGRKVINSSINSRSRDRGE
jgi:hypothetical protein